MMRRLVSLDGLETLQPQGGDAEQAEKNRKEE
jgi:hypothetical protein